MRRAWIGLLIASTACKSDVVVEVEVEPGVAYFATFDPDGRIVRTGRLLEDEERTELVDADGTQLWVWSFAAGAIVDRDGAPLPDAVLDTLAIDLGDTCGRCAVPGAPALELGPGDACPIASEPEGYDVEGALDPARAPSVRLSRPGPCLPPPVESLVVGADVDACPLWPPRAPTDATNLAVSASGAMVVIREGFVTTISRDGDLVQRPTVDVHREIQGVVSIPGSNDFVFAVKQQAKNDFKLSFYVVGPDAIARPLIDRAEELRSPVRLHSVHSDPGHFYVVGAGVGRTLVVRCSAAGACETQFVDRSACGTTDDLDTIAADANGRLFAVDGEGGLYTRGADERWVCSDALRSSALTVQGVELAISRTRGLAFVDDRWFACVEGDADGARTALVSGAIATDGSLTRTATVVGSIDGGNCLGVGALPHRPDEIVMNAGGGFVVGARSGAHVTTCTPWQHCAPTVYRPDEIQYVLGPFVKGGAAAYTTDRGHVFSVEADGRFVRRLGAPLVSTPGGAIAATDDGAIAFVPAGPVEVRHGGAGCGGFSVEEVTGGGAWTFVDVETDETTTSTSFPGTIDENYREAVRIGADRYLVAGSDSGRSWFVRTIDLTTRTIRNRYIDNVTYVDLAAFEDGRRALALTRDRIRVVETDSLRIEDPPITWDDPTTPVTEPPLAPFDALASVGVAGGVAWIVGGRAIVRAIAHEDEVRLEGWWSTALRGDGAEELDLHAVHVLAPDRWIAIGRQPLLGNNAFLDAWRMGPADLECPDANVRVAGLAMCPYEGFVFEALNAPDRTERAVAAAGDEANPTWLFSTGAVYRFGAARVVAPVGRPSSLVEVGDGLLVGGAGPLVGLAPVRD